MDEREKFVASLGQIMLQRVQAHDKLENYLKIFTTGLFGALESVLAELNEQKIPGFGACRRIKVPATEVTGLQIFIEDWSIIFVPLAGFARPNLADEARVPPYQFKETSARIAVFLGDEPGGRAIYDFIIFQDGSWFAWGYGWPKQSADITKTNYDDLALELLYSFVKDIYVTWPARIDTSLGISMDTKRPPYIFGLPGEDRQGT